MIEVNFFCTYELITIKLKLFDSKKAKFVVLKTERYSFLSIRIIDDIVIVIGDEFIF